MATISWLDKIDGDDLGNPRMNVNADDMNNIKNTVNTNAAVAFIKSFFVFNEVPTGLINSTNDTYTLVDPPITGTESLFRNGQKLTGGDDYSLVGDTLTITPPPQTGDSLSINYMKNP